MFINICTTLFVLVSLMLNVNNANSYSQIISGTHNGDITGDGSSLNDILVEKGSSVTGNIILNENKNIVTFENSNGTTIFFGGISLKGLENRLDLGDAFIQGNIEMGKSSSDFLIEDFLFLKGANVYGRVTMSANQNTIHFAENSHISSAIVMEGVLKNSFYLEDNAVLRTPSVFLGKNQSENLLSFGVNSRIENSTITMTGLKNRIIIKDNFTHSNSTITIADSAEIVLHTAKDYNSLFNLTGVTENMKLIFANGFVYTGNIVLGSNIAQNAYTKTLSLEGANIVGDIILSKGWKIDFAKALESGTLFTGLVRNENNDIVGLGISDGKTHVGDIVVNDLNGSIYITGGSTIEGSLVTSRANIYIKNATIDTLDVGENTALINSIANSTFRNKVSYTNTNFMHNSSIVESIFGDSSGGINGGAPLQDVLVLSNTSGNLTIENTIAYGNILIDANASTVMNTHFKNTNTVYGNIVGNANSNITIDSLDFYGDTISADILSVYSIDFNKRITTSEITEKKYIQASEIRLVDNNGESTISFESVNGVANDIEIHIEGNIIDMRSGHNPVFLVDVSFRNQNSDTIVLDKATFSSRNDIFAFSLTEPIKRAGGDLVIKDVITGVSSSTGMSPELYSNVIAGYDVELQERFDAVSNTNTYDLVVKGISPATLSYSAVVDKGHRYTHAFWSGMREGSKHRKSLGQKNGSLSIWTNNSYAFSQSISDGYTGKEDLFVGQIGIGGKHKVSSSLLVSYDIAGGYGIGGTDIVTKNIPTKGDLEAKTIAFQIALEKKLNTRNAFLFGITQWGDFLTNTVTIGTLQNRTSWNTLSANTVISLGHKYSFSSVTIESKVDTLYSYTSGVDYIAEDNTIIEIKHENRIYALPSITLTYTSPIHLDPFISTGLIVPLHKEREDRVLINGYDVIYRKEETMLQVDLGLRYAYNAKSISLLLYGTAGIEKPLSTNDVIDITFDLGLALAF